MKPLSELKAEIRDELTKNYIRVPRVLFGDEKLSVAYADGNGMTGFGICDGDVLFISSDREPRDHDVVLASADGQTFMRQLIVDEANQNYILHAEGIDHREDVISPDPEILGVLAYILKKV